MKFLSNIQMNDNGIAQIDLVQFNENVAEYTPNEREIIWNIEEKTFDVGLGNGVVGQMFEELFFSVKAVGSISNGDVVMFAGNTGNELLATKAINTIGMEPHFIMGVATEDIADEAYGRVTAFGKVRQLNTLDFDDASNQDEAILYLDPSSPGKLTNVRPTAPYVKSTIAAVTRWHAQVGSILVRPDFGLRLADIHDLNISNLSDNDILYYDDSSGTWKNKAFPNITTISSTAPSDPRKGDLWWDDSEGKLNIWDAENSEWINTIGSITVNAENVEYNNITSQALNTNVQGVIDEIFYLLNFADLIADGGNSSSLYQLTVDGGDSISEFENQINGGGS